MLLRAALAVADAIVNLLPARLAYRLADLAGDIWYRVGASRRRLVAANLARVCAATGRPSSGTALTAIVRAAFRHHARYYLELLRAPRYPLGRIDEIVDVPDWPSYEGPLRAGPSMLVGSHLGNFEPFGLFLVVRGIRPLAPIEEIEPRPLYEFLAARRGGGGPELVPVSRSRRALVQRLREGGMVAIIGDRDLDGDGQRVTLFGHPTTLPIGPAWLAVNHRAALIVGRCLRVGPDRFHAEGTFVEVPDTGDRREDVRVLVGRIAECFERDIGANPEQWWGAFQPLWPDLPRDR
jgi:phosphatidylinositol dimannoside acyltransferase